MSELAEIKNKIFLQILVPLAILIGLLFLPQHEILPVDYYRTQDGPVAIMLCAILALSAIWLPRVKLPATVPSLVAVLTFAIAMVLAGKPWLPKVPKIPKAKPSGDYRKAA